MSLHQNLSAATRTSPPARAIKRAPRVPHDPLAALVGDSAAFHALKQQIGQCARWDAPVLIEGATGTGKELVARAIHYIGPRVGNAFVPVNCGALPDSLVENELFGHQRGAYTGAHDHHFGLVAQAEGGTLFLDEIEALSPRAQATLLRFIQDATYRPLGSPRENRSDVRIVTASNVYLEKLAAAGDFRADLLYRLRVLNLTVPALAERGDDVLQLARNFIQRYARIYGLPAKKLHPDMMQWMRCHSWPGNVRELENLIHRAYLLTDGTTLNVPIPACTHDAAPNSTRPLPSNACTPLANLTMAQAKAHAIEQFEREYLLRLMAQYDSNVSRAARAAGKDRRSLGRLLKKHGIASLHLSATDD